MGKVGITTIIEEPRVELTVPYKLDFIPKSISWDVQIKEFIPNIWEPFARGCEKVVEVIETLLLLSARSVYICWSLIYLNVC